VSRDDEPAGSGFPDDDPRSRFYQGTIVRLFPGSRTGLVRSGSGREIPFAIADVRLLGTSEGFAVLREGMRVGFDVGRTSRGVRVTTLRV
jgi:hypothetical protein